MKVDEFIQKYNASNSKATILKSVFTSKYVNYEQKISDCKRITRTVCWKDPENRVGFELNTPMKWLFFITNFLERYTDIEFDYKGEADGLMSEYNRLSYLDVIGKFVKVINSDEELLREYSEYETILNECIEDELQNYRSMTAYLDEKSGVIKLFIDGILQNENVQSALQTLVANTEA